VVATLNRAPSNMEDWDKAGVADAVERLNDAERRLFTTYATRVALASPFGMRAVVPDGLIIRKIIDHQLKWEGEQAKQEESEVVLAAKLIKEHADAKLKMNESVTVTLLVLSYQDKKYQQEIYSFYFSLKMGF